MFSGRRIEKKVIEYEGGGPNPKRRRRLDGGTEGFEHVRENAITRRPMSRILARQCKTTAASALGTSGRTSRGETGGSVAMRETSAMRSRSSNGGRPVNK